MRLCVFEDDRVDRLEPLTLTRPAFDLWCGAGPLLERQCRYFGATEVGFVVRPALADWCRFLHPCHPVNEGNSLGDEEVLLVNARWLPPAGHWTGKAVGPQIARADDQVAYALATAPDLSLLSSELLAEQFPPAPQMEAGGHMIDYPWDLVRHNAEALDQDLDRFRGHSLDLSQDIGLVLIGPRERLYIDPHARVEPLAVIDTTSGPVIIERHALIRPFSRLEGPCYIGPGSHLLGAQVKASTIGPRCRVGGEVEASILQGFANKAHDGFLGHSYLGEWINLAAGTQVSDLRNDYGTIRVTVAGEEIDSGLMKVGAFLGDYTRTGVGALLNCGTVAGAFTQFLPWGFYLPRVVPSFCTIWGGMLQERAGFRQLFVTAATAMQRRGQVWKAEHTEFFLQLYETTADKRQEALRQNSGAGPEPARPCVRSAPKRRF